MAKVDKHPKVKPVIVRWIDSMGSSSWNDVPNSRMEITTVGNLIAKRRDRIVIASNTSHYGSGDYTEIPNFAVKSIRRLKE